MISEKQSLHIERLALLRKGQKLTWKPFTSHTQETKDLISRKLKGKLKGRKRDPVSVLKGAEKRKRGNYFFCLECGNKFWRQQSLIKKGHNKYCSKNCYQQSSTNKAPKPYVSLLRKELTGDKCPSWKGGITPINMKIRSSDKYKEWRTAIFKRDNYICQNCGTKSSKGHTIFLEAHHLKSFSNYPELRFEISNGITLCKTCHELTKKRKNGKYKAA